jgi:putative acetyltransferase
MMRAVPVAAIGCGHRGTHRQEAMMPKHETPCIRPSTSGDIAAIEGLTRAAFPDEDLLPLLHDLLGPTAGVLSLVAVVAGDIAGHAAFTRGTVSGGGAQVALLGPLAVAAAWRGRGIARALVAEGARAVAADGVVQLLVLGDPAFYGRLGFTQEDGVEPPFRLPPAWQGAWQTLRLRPDAPAPHGLLTLPEAWNRPALWAP